MNTANKLYLKFLEYVLPIFNNLNIEFQSESPKIYLLYDKIENAYRTLLSYYMNPEYLKTTDVAQIQYRNPTNYIPLDKIYCGPKIALALEKIACLMKRKSFLDYDLDYVWIFILVALMKSIKDFHSIPLKCQY